MHDHGVRINEGEMCTRARGEIEHHHKGKSLEIGRQVHQRAADSAKSDSSMADRFAVHHVGRCIRTKQRDN